MPNTINMVPLVSKFYPESAKTEQKCKMTHLQLGHTLYTYHSGSQKNFFQKSQSTFFETWFAEGKIMKYTCGTLQDLCIRPRHPKQNKNEIRYILRLYHQSINCHCC
jgi:hypothetical protein